jgi:hypothetical protein
MPSGSEGGSVEAGGTPEAAGSSDALSTDDGEYSITTFSAYDASFVAMCYPDNDGINGGDYTFILTVDDTGFSKNILATQNDAQATIKITNSGTKPHGFQVGCTSVLAAYPMLPKGCPASACFPANASITPLAPGATTTITFDTPTPDGLIYPFRSDVAGDENVPGLNNGQWTLM